MLFLEWNFARVESKVQNDVDLTTSVLSSRGQGQAALTEFPNIFLLFIFLPFFPDT